MTDWKDNWDCGRDSQRDQKLTPINIAVIGDSHAADKAMILRLQGFDPIQFTGGACVLDPNVKSCRAFFDFAKDHVRNDPVISEIWLSQSFRDRNLKPAAVERTLKYWSETGKDLVLFTNMPKLAQRKRDWTINAQTLSPELMAIYNKYDVELIDVRSMVCDENDECPNKVNGNIFYVDADHFSPHGAKFAGDNLMKMRPVKP